MVGKAQAIGDLLKLPNLEEETVAFINLKIREALNQPEPQVDPAAVSSLQSLLAEWTGGAEVGQSAEK